MEHQKNISKKRRGRIKNLFSASIALITDLTLEKNINALSNKIIKTFK